MYIIYTESFPTKYYLVGNYSVNFNKQYTMFQRCFCKGLTIIIKFICLTILLIP